ncbi:unnamed protein product [Eruca vesicaria subsp. sativa]|uniref:Uncharacterized protein n=1 Tax=Eruca vesicaria subsp. sativa TaxID=29727 RepID=A0ABC8KFQ4_ERUVS|nr:unnamed protein product [Eruca vesicaria subsp. sativa]
MFRRSRNREAFAREAAETKELVEKYGIFDLKGSRFGLCVNKCTKDDPCPRFVRLYAKMGLHRYNLLQGTKFKLKGVRKYIETLGSPAATYYITLYAIDQAGGSSCQTFQIQVSQMGCNQFMLTCDIARIRGECKSAKQTMLLDIRLPEWPPENPFERYCLGKEELKSNDWIRLYLKLTLATRVRYGDSKIQLEIVNVATDLVPPGLNAKNATFYIRYNDLSKIALGEVSDDIAIVRRRFDEDTGCFVLVGQSHRSSEILPEKLPIISRF